MTLCSTFARLSDRVRPWRAPLPPAEAPRVAVIGAGPAGLATAALLRRRGVHATVFDSRNAVGGSWESRYDSLRLNTVRWMSDLPGYRMPRSLDRWVTRDQLVDYYRDYCAHHQLAACLGEPHRVRSIHRAGKSWSIKFADHTDDFDGVVVATGHSCQQVSPEWPGESAFTGSVIHGGGYRRPADHAGQRVLVVGAGSTGGEICVDLARAGIDVAWAVRSAPQVFPREVGGVPTTPFGPVGDLLPNSILDRVGPWLERRIYGERDYLPEPTSSMMTLFGRCKEPMTADGIVRAIRSGQVRVVAAVSDLSASGAVLDDGAVIECDHVIAATGYRTGLEAMVGHLGVLDADGRPIEANPLPGLAFVGFRIPFTGTLWAIDADAHIAARALADQTANSVVRPQGLEP